MSSNTCWDQKNGHRFRVKSLGCIVVEACVKCGEYKHLMNKETYQ